jgi:hypothetical protein
MTVPNVTFTVLNGRLGVRPPGGVELHAYVGPATSGTANSPVRAVRATAVQSTFTSGQLVELASNAISNWKADVLAVRCSTTTAGVVSALVTTGVLGTSVVTLSVTTCDDDYEFKIRIVAGGTRGTAGITYQTSLDNGRTWSAVTALGTAIVITVADSGGATFAIGAGTLLAGDYWTAAGAGALPSTANLTTALNTLQSTLHAWKAVWIATPVSAADCAAITTFLNTLETVTGQSRKAYVSLRVPTSGETEAAYLTSVAAAFASFADRRITCAYAAARVQSTRTGRPYQYRRPALFAIAGLPGALALKVDMAQVVDATPGGLPGVNIYDENGNNVEHDEMLNPGGDDARFLCLRTHPGRTGVYVNNPKTLETAGGDFFLDQHVRILCEFCNETRTVLVEELSRDLDLNQTTSDPQHPAGAPTEAECDRIDERVLEAVRLKLKGQVTRVEFALNRDDLVLTSQTLNGEGGIMFKGYPKLIRFTVAALKQASTES